LVIAISKFLEKVKINASNIWTGAFKKMMAKIPLVKASIRWALTPHPQLTLERVIYPLLGRYLSK